MDGHDSDSSQGGGWVTFIIAGLLYIGGFAVMQGRLPSPSEATEWYSILSVIVLWGLVSFARALILGEEGFNTPAVDSDAQLNSPSEPEFDYGEAVELSSADTEAGDWMDGGGGEGDDPVMMETSFELSEDDERMATTINRLFIACSALREPNPVDYQNSRRRLDQLRIELEPTPVRMTLIENRLLELSGGAFHWEP